MSTLYMSSGSNWIRSCLYGSSWNIHLNTTLHHANRQNHSFPMFCAHHTFSLGSRLVSESMFLLFGRRRYMTIATLSNLLNNFRYHLVPFFRSSKYGCSIWSFRFTRSMFMLRSQITTGFVSSGFAFIYCDTHIIFVVCRYHGHGNYDVPHLYLDWTAQLPEAKVTEQQSSFISQQASAKLITRELFVPYLWTREIKLAAGRSVYVEPQIGHYCLAM
jgi:hypothetical protein